MFIIELYVSTICGQELLQSNRRQIKQSPREDSFAHQKCVYENIIVDLRIISNLTSKLNIKKRARVGPPAKYHLNGVLLAERYWSDIVCWLGLFVRTFRFMDKLNIF